MTSSRGAPPGLSTSISGLRGLRAAARSGCSGSAIASTSSLAAQASPVEPSREFLPGQTRAGDPLRSFTGHSTDQHGDGDQRPQHERRARRAQKQRDQIESGGASDALTKDGGSHHERRKQRARKRACQVGIEERGACSSHHLDFAVGNRCGASSGLTQCGEPVRFKRTTHVGAGVAHALVMRSRAPSHASAEFTQRARASLSCSSLAT